MRILLPVSALIVMFASTGCRTFTSPARDHDEKNGLTWMDYDATRRGSLVIPDGAKGVRVLAEPAPDAALNTVADFSGKVSYQGASGEAAAKVTETIAELGKRTESVMVLREALFRLSELEINNSTIDKTVIQDLYGKVLDTTKAIAEADAAAAKADEAKANADQVAATTETKKIELLQDVLQHPVAERAALLEKLK